ncbi:MAG: glycosyltransferase family 2 protein, partial [Actinomycetes bacterium]
MIVPIFNVERYLTDCLESLAQQTERDLEVIMVDDGSTDSSASIAAAFAEQHPRFRLIRQPNGGLGQARNTGADQATGDYLAFVDSDDVVRKNAYEWLSRSLDETRSDFATGNYQRLTARGALQAGMVASAFNATRLKTHVTKHPALLNDRTAWNKLWRRDFWTAHGFRWP